MILKVERVVYLFFWCFVLALPGQAFAGGFRLIDQDPYATARGNAFVATADRASAVYYNPAGMVQLDSPTAQIGYHLVHLDADYSGLGGESNTSNKSRFLGPPQLYGVVPVPDQPIALGFGLYSPFGLGLKWPNDSGFRTLTKKSELVYLTAAPSVAVALSDSFSLGASFNIHYADLELSQGLSPDPSSGQLALKGDGVAYGFALGALWRPAEALSFGARYLSPSYIDLDGTADINGQGGDMDVRFAFPDTLAFGVAYKFRPNLVFEVNYDWTNWDRLNTVTFETEPLGPLPIELNYSSSSVVSVGATYTTASDLDISVGYYFNENSVPTATFNPAVPDLDKHYLGIGVSKEVVGFEISVAYQYAFSGTRSVRGSRPSQAGESADGDYQVDIHALSLGISATF